MRKTITIGIVIVLVLMTFAAMPMNASADFAGGAGTEGDPYQIANVDQLQDMELDLDAHYVVLNDIDASATSSWNSGAGFDPVGDSSNKFTGSLDGNGYIITGLYINRLTETSVGVFGHTDTSAEITNTGLVNCDVSGYYYVGGLVGRNYGTVSNCYATGSVSGSFHAGGLVGWNYGGIEDCYATGSVSGSYLVGGLVGWNYGGIEDCYATGSVNGNFYVGGLVGWNYGGIEDSYATGSVSGYYYAGGLVGYNNGGTVSNCYATGSVNGNAQVGGLVGWNYGTVFNCFWDTETSGQSSSAGGTGKTTAEMKQQATFVGWDFTNIWNIIDGVTYPYFYWQISNQPPIANAGGPYEADEGSEITFDASGSSDPDDDELQYRWDFDNDGTWDTSYSTDPTAAYIWYDDYSGDVTVEVYDGTETDTATALVTVNNVAPTASIDNVVQLYSEFIMPTDLLEFYGSFTDPGTEDTHTIEWDFDDGTIITDTLTPTHAYTEPGLYTVALTITDDDDGIDTAEIIIEVSSPSEAAEEVVEIVEDIISTLEDAPPGLEQNLLNPLGTAVEKLEEGNENAGTNKLDAFINQVEAQRGKKLTEEQADALIAAAQWIIDNVEENGA